MDTTQESKSPVTIQQADQAIDLFLSELKTDKDWEKANSNERVTVWRKFDETTGIYRIKIIGRLPFPQSAIDGALFVHKNRKVWDQVVEEIVEIDDLAGEASILYITTRVPPGVAPRDFVHVRRVRLDQKDNSKIVLDVSTVSEKAPEKEGYVRAHTYYSGAIVESDLIPNMETKKLDEGTKYSMISQVDLKGYIPKTIINWALAYTTMEWFESLYKACEAFSKGQLVPKDS